MRPRGATATVRMHHLSAGSGDPILFLHGMPTSCRLWDAIIERMTDRFTCIAVDLPGFGRTPRLPCGFRELDSLVTSIETLRIEQGIEKWHIVGHDAGCVIGVNYAHRFPQRVGQLALLTPSIFPDLKPFYLFEILRKPVVGELLAPAINLLFWRLVMHMALEHGKGPESKSERNEVIRDFHAPFRGFSGAWRLMSLLRWGNPSEALASIPDQLIGLMAPTLLFHGTRDVAVPPAFAARAAELIPLSEVVLLDSGHFLPMSQPATIARELLRFFPEHFPAEPPWPAAAGQARTASCSG